MPAPLSARIAVVISVSITPGAMALTVMPLGPSSLLHAWVNVTTAAFEAA